MTKSGPKKNLAASVRAKLMQIARERREDFHFVLVRYGIERFLYRLAHSAHENLFIVKGAVLFTVWSGHPHRATKDLDLLGRGAPELKAMEPLIRDICQTSVEDDGLTFDAKTVAVERIKEDAEYEGVRVTLQAKLASAVIPIQIDIGFGDAVTPAPEVIQFPTLLGTPAPRLRAYPRETVVTEKLEAMVHLGMANSRMKDFYDLWWLACNFEFDGAILVAAMKATFERRKTPIPAADPTALTGTFANDETKQIQWRAFLNKSRVAETSLPLVSVIDRIRAFLLPVIAAARTGAAFHLRWRGGAWDADG